jgi:hypothetical protein
MKSQDSYYVDLGIDFIHTNEIVDKFIEHNSVAGKPSMLNYFNLVDFPNKTSFLQNVGIDKEFYDHTTIQKNIGRLPPHTDIGRCASLLCPVYGIADTVFYKSSTEDIAFRKVYNEFFLKEQYRVQFKIGRWYLFNNQEIHCVENMLSNDRIGLVINLNSFFKSYEEALNNIEHIVKRF